MSGSRWLAAIALAGILAPPAADAEAPWLTPAEESSYRATPSLERTRAFLDRLAGRMPELRVETFGVSPAGRPMTVAIVSGDGAFTPEAARAAGKPVVLVVNGIHSGEIDGKDACLELLRDLAFGRRRELIAAATLLVVPVYNVDGHERVSPWNRPNQDGPELGMGTRATVDGHDLNRDWLKAETPEARALLGLVRSWDPHLVVDDHVTDGVDHDWTITWSLAEAPQSPAGLAGWTTRAIAAGESAAAAAGYRAGPYVEPIAELDPTQGYETPAYGPRFSTGYFALRNRATILVETHSHKPFRDRVAANREFLAGVLAETARTGSELVAASAAADRAAVADRSPVVVDWETAAPGDDRRRFPIYEWRVERSVATGEQLLRFRRGVVREVEAPWRHGAAAARTVPRPAAYLVSAGWTRIADRLAIHGVRFERLAAPRELEVETLHVADAKPSARVYQGLVGLSARVERRRATIRFAAGDLWIPGDQPLFALAANLLEPEAEDSLFAWGLLSSIVEVREWIGPGELEDEAVRLLREPAVRAEWEAALADPAFAADAAARYRWWFERTPYFDESIGRLPVFRVPAGAELNAGR